ncbi:MAG: MYXO-CTERM sorting domain-containing protein [Myxococcota bacterium]|nr:MYXO-CTERM sorting domain-containing protein [Myxococcota bacterium]
MQHLDADRRSGRALLGIATALVASLAITLPAHAQPEMRGAHAVAEWDAGPVSAAGAMIRTRVVYPEGATARGPVVAVVHGYLRNGSYMMELARVLASRGIVAIVPDMPCGFGGCDHDANARQVSALLAWAIAQSDTSGSRIEGLVDPERRGAIGHSWGGLGTFLAVAGDPAIDVWVGLDPQEDGTDALVAAPDVAIPNLHLMAAVDGSCNGEWGANVASSTTATARLRATIAASGHCDPEEPTDAACDFACTAGDRSTSPMFRRYAVAFVTCVLGVDASMSEWIGGASFDADVSSGLLTGVAESGLDTIDCGAPITPVDGGTITPDPDAGTITPDDDAGTHDAATARIDASAPGTDASTGTETPGAGCGCRAASSANGAPFGLVTALAVAVLVRRRRR